LRAALRIHGTSVKKPDSCWVPWLTPVILSTKEAEIRRIEVGSQPGQNRSRDPISKKPFTKKGLVEWLKVKALSSNPSTAKIK
jgi:hypothetical protein